MKEKMMAQHPYCVLLFATILKWSNSWLKQVQTKICKEQMVPLLCFVQPASDHLEVVQCLVHAAADQNLQRNNGFTPLLFAVYWNYVDVARFLVHAGADTNKPGEDGSTPLLFASVEGHMELVRLLLEASADIDKASDSNTTPLLCAADEGHSELVRVFVEAGADKEEAKLDGSTPLLCAALQGHIDVVQILIEAGVNLNKYRDDGSTALTCAASEGHEEIVRVLLNAGADPKWSRQDGRTAQQLAQDHGYSEIAALMDGHKKRSKVSLGTSFAKRKRSWGSVAGKKVEPNGKMMLIVQPEQNPSLEKRHRHRLGFWQMFFWFLESWWFTFCVHTVLCLLNQPFHSSHSMHSQSWLLIMILNMQLLANIFSKKANQNLTRS